MFAFPSFAARASYRHAVRNCPVDSFRHIVNTLFYIKKPPPKWMEVKYVRVTYFHGQLPGNYRRRMCA